MATTTRRRPVAARSVETDEQKAERLDKELAKAYQDRENLDTLIEELEAQLDELMPPIQADDFAKNAMGARVKVLEVAQAFGSWAAQVVFVDGKDKPKDGKVYTYMVSDLKVED